MPPIAPILGQIALNAAIGIGASMLANAIRPQKQNSSAATSRGLRFEMTVGESVPVSAIWGRGRTGGQLTFAQEYGANNEWVKFKFDCGRGWYDSLVGVSADEKPMTLTGSNGNLHGRVIEQLRDAGGTPRGWIKWYSGAPGQAADAGLIAAAPTRWGTSHTATATPYVIVTLNYEPDMFPGNQLPTFGFDWRGLRLYDWRKDGTVLGGAGAQRWADQSTWTWSENPAVMAWNWRRGYWRNGVKLFGMGFSRYANDLAYFTAAANLAEEELYFEETTSWLTRYAFGREIGDDEEHLAVLRQFEESWCGSSFDRGGAYAPVPAASMLAVLTLEDRHRVDGAAVSADRWGKVSAKKTKVHGSYSPVSDLFTPTPYVSRINVDLEALTRGPKAIKFDQVYEHRAERAQMRAEIALRRNLFAATRTETFGPIANVLEPGDPITRNCEWGATLMIVDSVEPGPDGLGRVVTMTGWSNLIVPDPDEGFFDLPDELGPLPTAASRVLQVPGFDIDPLQRVTGGNQEPFGRATWTAIDDPTCDQVIVRVWPTAIPTEIEEFSADARLASAKIIGPLRPETNYSAIALLTRHDLRRTYPTDPVLTFTTGSFKPGVIGATDLTEELNARFDEVQAFLDEDVPAIELALSALEDELAAVSAQLADLNAAPDYNGATAYPADALVKYMGGLYRAKAATTGNLPTNTTFWDRIGDYTSLGGAVVALQARITDAEGQIVANKAGLVSTTKDNRRIYNALMAQALLNGEQGDAELEIAADQRAATAIIIDNAETEVSRIDGVLKVIGEQIAAVTASIDKTVDVSTFQNMRATVVAQGNEISATGTLVQGVKVEFDGKLADLSGDLDGLGDDLADLEGATASAIGTLTGTVELVQIEVGTKNRVFRQTSTPTASRINDLWIKTTEGDRLYRATAVGTENWVVAEDQRIPETQAQAQATATAVEEINAALGGNEAGVLVKFEAVATPDGASARWALSASTTVGGETRMGTMWLTVPEDEDEPVEIGFQAANTTFYNSAGVAIALFNDDFELRSANGKFILNMLTSDLDSAGNFSFG